LKEEEEKKNPRHTKIKMKFMFLVMLAFSPLLVVVHLQTIIPGFHTFIWNQLDSTAVRVIEAAIRPMPMIPSTPTKPSRQFIEFGAVWLRDTVGKMLANMAVKACIPRSFCTPLPW
jgi:hypothetical protein